MKTHLLITIVTLLFSLSDAISAVILFENKKDPPRKIPTLVYEMRFRNIPENLETPPFLSIHIKLDQFDKNTLPVLGRWRLEIDQLCRKQGGIRTRESHYSKLMPIIEEYLKKLKSLNPVITTTQFPRINEQIISPRQSE